MEEFYESLKKLLKDSELLLKPEGAISSKWVLLSANQQTVKEEKNEKIALSNSYARASSQISNLASYQACQNLFENDNVFKDASKLAGYWGTFRAIFQDVIHNCGQMRKNKVILNGERAIQRVNKLREELSASKVQLTSTARLLGVKLQCKEIVLPDGLSLYRLNKREINKRQPTIEPYSSNRESSQVAFQPTELRMSLKVPVNRSQDSAFFQANNEAQKIARNAFKHVLDAILLLKNGQIELSPQRFEGGPIGGITITGTYPNFMPILNVTIRKQDTQKIVRAYELVGGKSTESDKVITRALHRFLLGRKRRDLVDKLIDYVISWESLLLTQEGNPATNELIYRFSINGSSFITTISKSKKKKKYFKMMKSIYALRSDIVHGGDDKKINKNLKTGEFNNLDEVCKFLEGQFKAAIWWLIDITPQERPYKKKDGWEKLLWP